jgi:hypothetical protein
MLYAVEVTVKFLKKSKKIIVTILYDPYEKILISK